MREFNTGKPHEKVSEKERTFQSYVKDLRLTPEDFQKTILDVGAGQAQFAKWAKDQDISSKIYSLEPDQEMFVKENALVGRAEEIPMSDQSFDLVVSFAAIPNVYLGEKNAEANIIKSFSEMLRVLKNGGEVRLARVLIGYKYHNQRIIAGSLERLFKELAEKHNIEIERIHTPHNDVYEYEKHQKKGLLAESFLIILRKPKK